MASYRRGKIEEERKITLSTVIIVVPPEEIYTKRTLLSYSIIHIKESFLLKAILLEVPNGIVRKNIIDAFITSTKVDALWAFFVLY